VKCSSTQIFSQEQGFKIWILERERERDIYIYIAQVWILGNAFSFSQWPTRVGARLGSIYSLHTIIAIRGGGGRLLDQSGGTSDKSGEALWSPIRPDLSGPLDKFWATIKEFLEVGSGTEQV
jgi:hypothetical protein